MQKGKIKFFQIPIIKIGLWWIYFRRHTNDCGLIPLNGKIAKTFCISRRAMLSASPCSLGAERRGEQLVRTM